MTQGFHSGVSRVTRVRGSRVRVPGPARAKRPRHGVRPSPTGRVSSIYIPQKSQPQFFTNVDKSMSGFLTVNVGYFDTSITKLRLSLNKLILNPLLIHAT